MSCHVAGALSSDIVSCVHVQWEAYTKSLTTTWQKCKGAQVPESWPPSSVAVAPGAKCVPCFETLPYVISPIQPFNPTKFDDIRLLIQMWELICRNLQASEMTHCNRQKTQDHSRAPAMAP